VTVPDASSKRSLSLTGKIGAAAARKRQFWLGGWAVVMLAPTPDPSWTDGDRARWKITDEQIFLSLPASEPRFKGPARGSKRLWWRAA
jgi:hypothetical protein